MNSKNNLSSWILAARPKTLPAGAGPVLLGLSLAYHQLKTIDVLTATLTILTALPLQISSNLINDYYDGVRGLDDETRLGPPRALALGLISAQKLKIGFQSTLLLSFLMGIHLMITGGIPIIIIGLSSLFFAWAYTGGPFPLSYLGLGEVFAFIFFGPVAVYGTWFLQSGEVYPSYEVILLGSSIGLLSSALMGVNNLRDRFSDEEKGKRTMATVLGGHNMRKLIVFFVMASQTLAFFTLIKFSHLKVLISFIPLCLFYKLWWQLLGSVDGRDLNLFLARVGKYLFFFSLTISCLFIF